MTTIPAAGCSPCVEGDLDYRGYIQSTILSLPTQERRHVERRQRIEIDVAGIADGPA